MRNALLHRKKLSNIFNSELQKCFWCVVQKVPWTKSTKTNTIQPTHQNQLKWDCFQAIHNTFINREEKDIIKLQWWIKRNYAQFSALWFPQETIFLNPNRRWKWDKTLIIIIIWENPFDIAAKWKFSTQISVFAPKPVNMS